MSEVPLYHGRCFSPDVQPKYLQEIAPLMARNGTFLLFVSPFLPTVGLCLRPYGGPYSRTMPRTLQWSYRGGGQFLTSEVPLYLQEIAPLMARNGVFLLFVSSPSCR